MAVLETPRLFLRPYDMSDAEAVFAVFGDPEVMRYIGTAGPDQTVEQTRVRLQRYVGYQREEGLGFRVVIEKASGRIIGDCGLKRLEDGPTIEVGWRFARARWGHGYATEAAAETLTFGFETLGLTRVVAVIQPENGASRRVAEKCGMRLSGPGRHYGCEVVVYEALG